MHVLQYPLADYVVQICLHKLEEQVDVLVIISPDGIVQLDDVGVLELLQNLDLAIGTLGIRRMLECIEDLLQGHHLLGPLVFHLPHMTVGTRTHLL